MSISFAEPSAVQRIRDNIARMFQTMNDMRRFQTFNSRIINNSTLTATQKTETLNKLQTAVQKFFTDNKSTSDTYLAQTNTAATSLNVMTTLQQCQSIIQTALVSQVTTANTMMTLPGRFCTELKTAFAIMEKSFDTALQKIGATVSK